MTTDPNTLKSTTTQQKENDVGLHNVGYRSPQFQAPLNHFSRTTTPHAFILRTIFYLTDEIFSSFFTCMSQNKKMAVKWWFFSFGSLSLKSVNGAGYGLENKVDFELGPTVYAGRSLVHPWRCPEGVVHFKLLVRIKIYWKIN